MRRAYLIDGYNLLHAIGLLNGPVARHGLEHARNRLIELLAKSFGDETNLLTVVFDSSRAPPNVPREGFSQGVHILFAPSGQEADDLIEDLLARDTEPRHLVVVSSDHRLQVAAKHRQAQSMTCDVFLDHLESRRQPAPTSPAESTKPVNNLSEEEKKSWLEEFKDLQKYLDGLDPY